MHNAVLDRKKKFVTTIHLYSDRMTRVTLLCLHESGDSGLSQNGVATESYPYATVGIHM
jgi:hypothetical protein